MSSTKTVSVSAQPAKLSQDLAGILASAGSSLEKQQERIKEFKQEALFQKQQEKNKKTRQRQTQQKQDEKDSDSDECPFERSARDGFLHFLAEY
jgi:Sec-independent protein translocase protein TatA